MADYEILRFYEEYPGNIPGLMKVRYTRYYSVHACSIIIDGDKYSIDGPDKEAVELIHTLFSAGCGYFCIKTPGGSSKVDYDRWMLIHYSNEKIFGKALMENLHNTPFTYNWGYCLEGPDIRRGLSYRKQYKIFIKKENNSESNSDSTNSNDPDAGDSYDCILDIKDDEYTVKGKNKLIVVSLKEQLHNNGGFLEMFTQGFDSLGNHWHGWLPVHFTEKEFERALKETLPNAKIISENDNTDFPVK